MKIKMLKSVGVYKAGDIVDMERKRAEQYIFGSLAEEPKQEKAEKKVEKKPAKKAASEE